jgi:hypothetical protein
MTNLAMDDRYLPLATAKAIAYLDPSKNVRQFNQTTHQREIEYPPVDLGLKSGAKIVWTSDRRDFPAGVQRLVNKIREFEGLQANWDSYGAIPHDSRSQNTALDLIFYSNRRSTCPDVVPLQNGGIGLRWTNDGRELEVDVSANGTCEILLADNDLAIAEETEVPVDAVKAKEWLDAFWRVG